MEAGELCFSEYLVAEFTSAFHDCPEHLIIAATCEEDFTSIKLKERAPNRPHIDTKVIWHTENY